MLCLCFDGSVSFCAVKMLLASSCTVHVMEKLTDCYVFLEVKYAIPSMSPCMADNYTCSVENYQVSKHAAWQSQTQAAAQTDQLLLMQEPRNTSLLEAPGPERPS